MIKESESKVLLDDVIYLKKVVALGCKSHCLDIPRLNRIIQELINNV